MLPLIISIRAHFISALTTDDHLYRRPVSNLNGSGGVGVVAALGTCPVAVLCSAEEIVLPQGQIGLPFERFLPLCPTFGKNILARLTAFREAAQLFPLFLGGQAEAIQSNAHAASVFSAPFRHNTPLSLGWKNDWIVCNNRIILECSQEPELAIYAELL